MAKQKKSKVESPAAKGEPNKGGRPSVYSNVIADIICTRLAAGESLRGICRDEALPDAATVFRWLASSDERYGGFREQYARARDIQADALVDEILDISDDGTNDWMERKGADGQSLGWQLNGEHVQRSRLRVDSRKWFASKVAPKKYGDKITVGGDAESPLAVVMEAGKTLDAKLDRLIARKTETD